MSVNRHHWLLGLREARKKEINATNRLRVGNVFVTKRIIIYYRVIPRYI